jgi:hypothetical protein
MLKIVPPKYNTMYIKIAKGKNKLPSNLKEIIKKIQNG